MLLAAVLLWGGVEPLQGTFGHTLGYEDRLFDQSTVHTIDIVMEDWDSFIANAAAEEYADCDIVIDGERFSHVAIRAKGNTSLSSVATLGSTRYSFKVEFDHFVSDMTYHGLDKLSLNNLIQDATMMKDYLAYTLMNRMGVPSSLCSYVQISVNGEPWGLYLAVEGVEDAFMERNSFSGGELYKPDSMSFGGGRGNGRDFDMSKLTTETDAETDAASGAAADASGGAQMNDGSSFGGSSGESSGRPEMPEGGFSPFDGDSAAPGSPDDRDKGFDGGGFGGFSFGMGSEDVKLIYSDDDPDSYSNIFNNAKTKVSKKDQKRLIESLRKLNEGEDVDEVVNTDEVICYLAVHIFLCNDDSYTGMMVHNYYLYEKDGQLSILPWDYNLAFGGFSASTDATSTVNSPIDSPVSGGTVESRPLIAWIFDSEDALTAYHEAYSSFLAENIENGWLEAEISRVQAMITPYLEQDTSAFYDMTEFEKAVDTLKTFCAKRCESIRGQLEGTIPSTTQGQQSDRTVLVDASDISTADMGSMNTTGGGGGFGMPGGGNFTPPDSADFTPPDGMGSFNPGEMTDSSGGKSADTATAMPDASSQAAENPADPAGAPQTPPSVPGFSAEVQESRTGAWLETALCAAVLLAAILIIRRAQAHNA